MFILSVCLCYRFIVWHCIYPIINYKGIWWYDCNVYLFFLTEISGWWQISGMSGSEGQGTHIGACHLLALDAEPFDCAHMDAQHNFDQVAFFILCLPFHVC
jgi:hypothetical protein